ncbi:MAG: PKD domain-containing protein [candidate division Zixibacteria bacterium]|nr:PKD domain-containing protein [candidate division Zixibacteria bacterium]
MKRHQLFSQVSLFTLVTLVLIVSIGLWIGCSEESAITNAPKSAAQSILLNNMNPGVQAVMAVQDRSTEALMSHPDVVGTGTGRNEDGELAVVVYTVSRVPQRGTFTSAALGKVDALDAIPETIDGLPVVAKVTGKFVIYADPKARFDRPVPIGVSTGHPDITAGTIGCRVKDAGGNVYALSNNHIYANVNAASIGDNVLQPGPTDGGTDPADAIGTLYDYEPILLDGSDNYIDAAIALTTTGNVGTATPTGDGYGTPSTQIVSASIGQNVQKYGRTTGWTHGEVSEVNVTVEVCYIPRGPMMCAESAIMVDQIAITPGAFSDGGDSGSLIVTDDGKNNPVGLLFAGSPDYTLANPIHYVLDRFNVTIDDGGGVTNYPPTADFSYTTTDLTADFTDLSTDSDGSVVGWDWDFGDGNTSTTQNPSHTYGSDGTYSVSLTVTDDDGATGSTSKDVTVSSGVTNDPPIADFSFTTTDLTADFTDLSTDSDGSVVGWDWNFGDGSTSTAQNPSHTYGTDGTYSVSLTVTDDDGATGSTSKDVSVSSGGTFTLTATGYKVKGRKQTDLEWSGATGTDVEIYRDRALLVVTENDGFYTDVTTSVGGGSFTYQVCEIGGSPCSNEVTVTY